MSLCAHRFRPVVVVTIGGVLGLAACSGGGGGAAARTAPTIANLELSPRVAHQDLAPRQFTVAFDLFDANRDVTSASFVLRDAAGQSVDQRTLPVPSASASVRVQGAAMVALPQVGTFTVEIWTTDAGGLTSNSLTATVEVVPYPWSELPADLVRRRDAAAVALDGQVYVIGGERMDLGTIPGPTTSIVARFDPITGTWHAAADLAVSRRRLAVAIADGFLYAIGGEHHSPMSASFVTGAVERYEAAASTWTARAAMPSPRQGIAAATVGNRIYVVGGGEPFAPLATVASYDPVSDTWRPEPAMLHARFRPRATAFGGRLVVAGGERSPGNCENRVEVFDPATGVWSTTPDANVCATWLVTSGGRMFAGAGAGLLASDAVDPPVWRGGMQSRRGSSLDSAACATGDAIYVFGDLVAERYVPAHEIQ